MRVLGGSAVSSMGKGSSLFSNQRNIFVLLRSNFDARAATLESRKNSHEGSRMREI
jgi:hypothetical protein